MALGDVRGFGIVRYGLAEEPASGIKIGFQENEPLNETFAKGCRLNRHRATHAVPHQRDTLEFQCLDEIDKRLGVGKDPVAERSRLVAVPESQQVDKQNMAILEERVGCYLRKVEG